jgi:hypothetical protein
MTLVRVCLYDARSLATEQIENTTQRTKQGDFATPHENKLTHVLDAFDEDASFHVHPMMDRRGIRILPVAEDASDVDASHGVAAVAGLSPPSSVLHAGPP